MKLSNEEFQRQLLLDKVFEDNNTELPGQGESRTFNLINSEYNERFLLDINRSGKIELRKYTLQDRYQKSKMPLVRVDIDGPTHRNPDGRKISRNHIHIYQDMETEDECRGLPWAYEITDIFQTTDFEFMNILDLFCKYCHIDDSNLQRIL